MPRIFDCFTFYNENDVLAIRLEELSPVVDKFVIVHSNKTFRGEDKPDYFDYDRFRPYKDQIELLVYDLSDRPDIGVVYESPWQREIAQRDAIHVALAKTGGVDGEDTIIISDVDEIPRRSVVKPVEEETRLIMDKYSYAINMLTDEGNSSVRMVPYWMLWHVNSPEGFRRGDGGNIVRDAGWEFSSLGTPSQIMDKFRAFSHTEFDNVVSEEIFAERIYQGIDLLGRDIKHKVVEIDETFPEAIKNNRQYWSKYEW